MTPLREQIASIIDAHPPLEDSRLTADLVIGVVFGWLLRNTTAETLEAANKEFLRHKGSHACSTAGCGGNVLLEGLLAARATAEDKS